MSQYSASELGSHPTIKQAMSPEGLQARVTHNMSQTVTVACFTSIII